MVSAHLISPHSLLVYMLCLNIWGKLSWDVDAGGLLTQNSLLLLNCNCSRWWCVCCCCCKIFKSCLPKAWRARHCTSPLLVKWSMWFLLVDDAWSKPSCYCSLLKSAWCVTRHCCTECTDDAYPLLSCMECHCGRFKLNHFYALSSLWLSWQIIRYLVDTTLCHFFVCGLVGLNKLHFRLSVTPNPSFERRCRLDCIALLHVYVCIEMICEIPSCLNS
jgi:hypothetical protein